MNTARYADLVESGRPLLTDAATGTRVRLETGLTLDPHLDLAGLAADGREAVLRAVAGEYVAIGTAFGLAVQLDAMTYWANPDVLTSIGRRADLDAVNRACVSAVLPVREAAAVDVVVAGVIGPREDGYAPSSSGDAVAAEAFHAHQAEALAGSGADVLFAETISTAGEALGVAKAMAATTAPYVVSFVIDRDGRLPDGSTLGAVMGRIDDQVVRPPVHFMVNCVHPDVALAGLRRERDRGTDLGRLRGLKANGSSSEAQVLEASSVVLSDPPLGWARSMERARREFDLRVVGGCCGTDGRHLLALAVRLAGLVSDEPAP